ncbi:putative Transcriptional regulator, LuxR family [Rhodospirillaceae bacterium LM-1]|nr:putative Transcriptional regulator, LuxR family [Rhodospirillaceae bacterium LM-1]
MSHPDFSQHLPLQQDHPLALDQLHQLSNCLIDIYHVDTHCDRSTFIDLIFDRYARLIPHDAALWSGTSYGPSFPHDPAIRYMHFYNLPNAISAFWQLKENYQARAEMIAYQLANPGKGNIVNAKTPGLEHVFPQLFASQGIRHLLAIYLLDPATKLFSIISLYRFNDAPYTEAERCLHELASPHIQAVLRLQALALLDLSGAKPDKESSMAVADSAGALHHAHPLFLQIVKQEWPDWQGPELPQAVANGNFLNRAQTQFVGKRIVILSQPQGELHLLSARHKDRFDDLTRRERQIAGLFASGLSYKEVARQLDVSPITVRNTLANIYKKVGVSDKGELTNILATRALRSGPEAPGP